MKSPSTCPIEIRPDTQHDKVVATEPQRIASNRQIAVDVVMKSINNLTILMSCLARRIDTRVGLGYCRQ